MTPRQTRKLVWMLLIMLVALPFSVMMTTTPAMAQSNPCQPYEIKKIYISTVDDFDLNFTRTNGSIDIQEDGAHIETTSADYFGKAAGYMELVGHPLLSEITYYDDDYIHESGTAMSGQLTVDMDDDGTFTDGVDKFLAYEDVYQDTPGVQKWWSFHNFGVASGSGYPTMDTLANIAAANPTLRALHTGFSLGSGVIGKGVLKSIQVNCTMWVFDSTPPPQLQSCSSYTEVRVTPINDQSIDYSQTRSAGHYEYMSNGLDIWTDDASTNAKVAGYIPVDYPLEELADFVLDYTPTTGATPPGGQALVDRTGDGLTVDDGILVFEPDDYPEGVWWSNQDFGVESGGGYQTYATINRILEVNPNAKVLAVGFSLGSGVLGSGTIHSITAGCVVYEFGLEQVEVQEPTVNQIDQCNEYGSITVTEVEGVVQTLDPEGATEGEVEWTAEAEEGYELLNYSGPKTYDLGSYYTCPAIVVEPIVIEITECGMYGGVFFPALPNVIYDRNPDVAVEGEVTVTAEAAPGYHLVGYTGPWQYDLGTYEMCPPEVVTETVIVTNTQVVTSVVVVTDSQVVTSEVVVTNTQVVTNEVIVTNTVPVTTVLILTDTIIVTDTQVVTNTEIISNEVIVTNTVPVTTVLILTDTIIVTDTQTVTKEVPVTTTLTFVEAASPVFINPTCALPVAQIYIPASNNFDYITPGDAAPGVTVIVRAILKEDVDATPTGQTEFPFTFLSLEQLNCPEALTERIYFPQLGK